MSASLLVFLGLLTTSPEPRLETGTSRPAAESVTGRSPSSSAAELLRQALVCERQGLESERRRLQQLAVETAPTNVTARGLLGQMQVDGQWLTPEQAAHRERTGDERAALLAEYETRRASGPRHGLGAVEAGSLVRAAWAEGGIHRPPHSGHPPGPDEPGRPGSAWAAAGTRAAG